MLLKLRYNLPPLQVGEAEEGERGAIHSRMAHPICQGAAEIDEARLVGMERVASAASIIQFLL
jgi:hypothetical protein